MDLQLKDRVAIVTGGSAGIGYAIARALSAEGARVIITARRHEVLRRAAEALGASTGYKVSAMPADTTDQQAVNALIEFVRGLHGRVEILVNCAASPGGLVRNEIEQLDDAALLQDLNTKVVGYARCCRAVAPLMKRQGWGRIVNIGGLTGRSSATLSGLRNAAICHLTKSLSDQLGPNGITVNAVHPGIIRTEHLDELFRSEARKQGCLPEQVEAQYREQTPIRRILSAEEIAATVSYLASPQAASITGESIAVDGGITRGIYL